MGFKEVKKKVIECLNSGNITHEARSNIDVKNLLSTGAMSSDEVIKILASSRGDSYSTSPHDYDSSVDVHIIKTRVLGVNWYIKWYFAEPDCVVISVHN